MQFDNWRFSEPSLTVVLKDAKLHPRSVRSMAATYSIHAASEPRTPPAREPNSPPPRDPPANPREPAPQPQHPAPGFFPPSPTDPPMPQQPPDGPQPRAGFGR